LKIALCTDQHFGSRSSSKKWLQYQLDFFTKQMFPYIKDNKIEHVFFLGDLLHNRSEISLEVLNKITTEFFKPLSELNVNTTLILGNHDLRLKHSDGNLDFITELKYSDNFNIIETHTQIELNGYDIHLVPFNENSKVMDIPPGDILFGHFDMKNFKLNRKSLSRSGFEPTELKEWSRVYSGHYHVPSRYNNVTYIGSPFQIDLGSFGEDLGFTILDLTDDAIKETRITNNITPIFKKVIYNEIDNDNLEISISAESGVNNIYTKADLDGNIKSALTDSYLDIKVKQVKNKELYQKFIDSCDNVYKWGYFYDTLEELENIKVDDNELSIIEIVYKFIDQNSSIKNKDIIKHRFTEYFTQAEEQINWSE